MFKSVFSKYLTAFIVIILLSFLMLSGIITSMIRTYVSEEKEYALAKTSGVISDSISQRDVVDLKKHISSGMVSITIKPLINNDSNLDIIITDENGKVLLSTIGTSLENERVPIIDTDLGAVDVRNDYFTIEEHNSDYYYSHRGNLGGYLEKNSIV